MANSFGLREMPSRLFGVAVAEMRSARRLARYWTFVAVAFVLGFGLYLYYGFLHVVGSGHTVTAGMIVSPKVLFFVIGGSMSLVLQVCMIFLAFDVRARDRRERVAEVLDARPLGNFAMLLGRALGLVVLVWIPVLVVAALILVVGAVADEVGWWIGDVQPSSFAALMLVDMPVLLFQWCTLVVLLAVVLRNRLVTAIGALAVVALFSWAGGVAPAYALPLFGFGGSAYPSDMIPVFMTGTDLSLRFASVAVSMGLLVLAAMLYPRRDGISTSMRLAVGMAYIGLGVAVTGIVAAGLTDGLDARRGWADVHRAAAVPRADIEHVAGTVAIEPGELLGVDVDIQLRPAGSRALVLSFNPGMSVTELLVDGVAVDYTFESGLLTISPETPFAEGRLTLSLVASGVPQTQFAYLDSVVVPETTTGGASMIAQLGIEAGLFDGNYVALMPGIRWLPIPGSNYGDDDPSRGRDYFTVDIEVEAPPGWTVAGPGRAEATQGGVRFRPPAPVPAVALLAAAFERRELTVAGTALELLLHPGHAENLDFFADSIDELTARLEEMFADAARLGLPYPYETLSVAEVPSRLRGYAGGWRMDTVLSQPGLLLLREFGLPIARFDAVLDTAEPWDEKAGGIGAAKIGALTHALADDFAGGNVFSGAVHNVLSFQTGATGPGAAAIDYVLHDLANRLLTGHPEYFSAYRIAADFQYASQNVASRIVPGLEAESSVVQAVAQAATSRPSVWDRVLAEPLASMNVHDDPERAFSALRLKGTAIADVILDDLGRARVAALLAELRSRHTGGNFTSQDLERVAASLDIDLDALIGGWLHETALPGFLTSEVRTGRLDDDDDDRPRYQLLLHVRNDEPAPGLCRVVYLTGDWKENFQSLDPVRIPGNKSVEIGVTGPEPFRYVRLDPYLSLNRLPVELRLSEIDMRELEPFVGVRPSDWRPAETGGIVVDDLDPGFTVESDADGGQDFGASVLSFFGGIDVELDQGLARFNPPFYTGGENWTRQTIEDGWGKYRRTTARASSLNGRSSATFTATLPDAGQWRLEFHLPVVGEGEDRGPAAPYRMDLFVGDRAQPLEFDASIAEPGWNHLGDFDIESPEVRVVVSSLSSGHVIYADAIRWSPPP